jgi:class 3 adenylate cyclase
MARGVAVVLFTDLVGSTELRGRLGEEPTDELRRRHDQALTQAVEANNGQVIKGLGDGIMATFAGASDAVAAAVVIQQAVDRLNRSGKAPVSLSVRVGLSAGDVTFEDADVHGTPVIEASRLCATAQGGEILASDLVVRLAGSGSDPAFMAVGPLELKGLDQAVPAVRVEWEPAAMSAVPMPTLLTDVGRIFVGRDAELERLQQLWKEAAAGERRVALVAGEPGVGKTRLAAELAIRVYDEGGIVLAGRCDEDLGVPYQPFVEALRHFVEHTPPSELKERLGRYGGDLVRLVPELSERVPDLSPPLQSDPETERYRLFDAVAVWVAAASTDAPLLLVFDDLQWAAKPTVLLLRHVVRSAQTDRVLLVGTYRDTEFDHDHPLLQVFADLRRQQGVERLSLVGLDSAGVAAFMEQAAGHRLGDEDVLLARAIHDETEGNPFFVREVLRHLSETGALERQEGRLVSRLPIEEIGIPEGVRDVVSRRLSRLSAEANRALRVAAVVGTDFEMALVGAATPDLDEDELLSAMEEATGARVVLEAPGRAARYRFAHALVRDTLYAGLSSGRRVTLHRRVAEAIESLQPTTRRLAITGRPSTCSTRATATGSCVATSSSLSVRRSVERVTPTTGRRSSTPATWRVSSATRNVRPGPLSPTSGGSRAGGRPPTPSGFRPSRAYWRRSGRSPAPSGRSCSPRSLASCISPPTTAVMLSAERPWRWPGRSAIPPLWPPPSRRPGSRPGIPPTWRNEPVWWTNWPTSVNASATTVSSSMPVSGCSSPGCSRATCGAPTRDWNSPAG